MASQVSFPKSQPLNPNAEPFYLVPRQLTFLPQLPHLYGSIQCRISVSAVKNTRCHQQFPMGYEGTRTTVAERVKYEWRVKGTTGKVPEKKTITDGNITPRAVIPFPTTIEEAESCSTTTVMIRNVPNQLKFNDLLLLLDDHCFQQNKNADDPADWSKFDFLYLPMDYRKHAVERKLSNLGYAFVNFTTPSAAFKFYRQFHGYVWNITENRKTCEINAAQYQGKDGLIRIFHQKVFRCKNPQFLPIVFAEGRDGLNRRMEGTPVGKYVWGLPRKSIGN